MENLLACLIFDYSRKVNKVGDRIILKADLTKLCQAASKLLEIKDSKADAK